MNHHPSVTWQGEPVELSDLTIPPHPTMTRAAFTLAVGPLSVQIISLARQIVARIEAGHYRRLPAVELSGLRLCAMILDQIASQMALAEELTPRDRRRRWWRIWG